MQVRLSGTGDHGKDHCICYLSRPGFGGTGWVGGLVIRAGVPLPSGLLDGLVL